MYNIMHTNLFHLSSSSNNGRGRVNGRGGCGVYGGPRLKLSFPDPEVFFGGNVWY